MEKAVLDLKSLKVTQGMNGSYSHKGVLAIDIAGHGDFKAPFTGVIKKIYPTDHEVWLESSNKVKYADGTEDLNTSRKAKDNMGDNYVEYWTASAGTYSASKSSLYTITTSGGSTTKNLTVVEYIRPAITINYNDLMLKVEETNIPIEENEII